MSTKNIFDRITASDFVTRKTPSTIQTLDGKTLVGFELNNRVSIPSGLVLGYGQYINFDSLYGDAGYGIRDNGGVVECKDGGGEWLDVLAGRNGTPLVVEEIQAVDATGILLKDSAGTLDVTIGGENAPLHVSLGSAGTDPAWTSTIDALIVESAAANNCTIEVFTAADKIGNYGFADTDARNVGGLAYNHATDTLSLRAGSTAVMAVSATTVAFLVSPPTHADNAAAIAGGLVAGNVYRTATGQLMMVY